VTVSNHSRHQFVARWWRDDLACIRVVASTQGCERCHAEKDTQLLLAAALETVEATGHQRRAAALVELATD
jgi:hypothetical protein